jgi:hypothetical protein
MRTPTVDFVFTTIRTFETPVDRGRFFRPLDGFGFGFGHDNWRK